MLCDLREQGIIDVKSCPSDTMRADSSKKQEVFRNRNLQVDQEHGKRMWSTLDSPM
jgi:hypothetical protein